MKKQTTQPTSNGQGGQLDAQKGSRTGNTKKKVLIVVLILVLILIIGALAAIIFNLLKSKETSDDGTPTSRRNTVVSMDNKDEILADLNNKIAEGLFEVKMNVEWSFEDSSTPSENAYVANVTSNSNTVYFDVTLDSTGETIYESPYLPVGSELSNIALSSQLAAGTYPCTLTYHLIDDDYNDVSTMAVTVTLSVLN
jgi:hypothetical protein